MGIGNIGKTLSRTRKPHGPTTADGAERRAENQRQNAPSPGARLPGTADAAERWIENRRAQGPAKVKEALENIGTGLTSAFERQNQSESAQNYSAVYS